MREPITEHIHRCRRCNKRFSVSSLVREKSELKRTVRCPSCGWDKLEYIHSVTDF